MTETTTCTRCGRVLRTTASITRGTGATCAKRIRQAAAAADYKPAQVEKARELIADGGITLARRGLHVFRAVASDGTRTYLVGPTGCTCPAGTRGHGAPCYHRAARAILAA